MKEYAKRIGIDARLLLLPQRGMPLYLTRICQYLPRLNRDYLFYLFINRGYEHNDCHSNYLPVLNEIAAQNENVVIVNCDHEAKIWWEQAYLPQLLRTHQIDLLLMPANRIVFFTSVPTIVTVHDVMELLFLKKRYLEAVRCFKLNLRQILYSTRSALYSLATYRIGIGRAARIITVSEYSAADITKHLRIARSRIDVISHGLDEVFVNKDLLSGASTFKQKYVLMLGGDSSQKNPEGAIAAWAKLPVKTRTEYQLKIIGFTGGTSSPLLSGLKTHNLEGDIEVKGWVTQDDLIRYMKEASLFIYLSRYEGFGFPLLHAMASGTPVISSNRASIPEVLGEVGLQFDPDDSDGVAEGIQKMLTDSKFRDEQVAKGFQRSLLFSWEASASRHLQVIDRVLGN